MGSIADEFTVWKFPFLIDDECPIEMPGGAKVLYVDTQGGAVCLWALVNPSAQKELRNFCIRGTGHPLGAERHTYHGSVQQGPFVWHVFERDGAA